MNTRRRRDELEACALPLSDANIPPVGGFVVELANTRELKQADALRGTEQDRANAEEEIQLGFENREKGKDKERIQDKDKREYQSKANILTFHKMGDEPRAQHI